MSSSNLCMPESIILDEQTRSEKYGKFIVQPLERGFGVTLGNTFRRVLLSSLQGAAITAIKISGVLHEFSTIPDVVEDVSEIILNLKEIRIKMPEKKVSKVTIKLKGPKEFTGQDIQDATNEFTVLNPEMHIATLGDTANFEIELRVAKGMGYVPADENKLPDQEIGVIPIDSIFTPIKNVKYSVESTRVGQRTDYEKLILEVETDGSITPEEALTYSGKVLRDHIQLFINFDSSQERKNEDIERDQEIARIRRILKTPVDELELSVRSHNCLKAADIKTIADLVRKDESEMLKFRNFGRKSLAELIEIIEGFGLSFGMDVDKYLKDDAS
ncbi:MAG TPA: DNA-directed RNA polymerase subunit alpha [Bacteroidota bacterium]|jgi:DNA-directed RNA polymerase subunit alpha|nr:DNA-directed RNA polymerase subunit alpha [Bacteroidota bacterium]